MSEIKVYKANFEMYEGWSICEHGKSGLELPDDFHDEDKFFILKSDHDQKVKLLETFARNFDDYTVHTYECHNAEISSCICGLSDLRKQLRDSLTPKPSEG